MFSSDSNNSDAHSNLYTEIEICGLHSTTNDRICKDHHPSCGSFLALGDIVTFKEVVLANGETAAAVHSIDWGCRVGFVSKSYSEIWPALVGEPTYGFVVELYAQAEEKHVRRISYQQKGVAHLRLNACFFTND